MRTLDYTLWDLLIAHPDCRYMAGSGAKWRYIDGNMENGIDSHRIFWMYKSLLQVRWILNLPVPRISLENPVGAISTYIRKPDQIIQPWQFGHGETKATCLWLKNLPQLKPTEIVSGRKPRVHYESPGPGRSINRARTYQGIAEAMSLQWSNLI